jgi:ABC-type polar amino acid transport system ATPase subunit
VVSLIERFYDVNSGSIEYSGVDLKSLNLKWYRDQIGMYFSSFPRYRARALTTVLSISRFCWSRTGPF